MIDPRIVFLAGAVVPYLTALVRLPGAVWRAVRGEWRIAGEEVERVRCAFCRDEPAMPRATSSNGDLFCYDCAKLCPKCQEQPMAPGDAACDVCREEALRRAADPPAHDPGELDKDEPPWMCPHPVADGEDRCRGCGVRVLPKVQR